LILNRFFLASLLLSISSVMPGNAGAPELSTGDEAMSTTRNTEPVPALLYPTLLIAGIAVIIASMLGIAVMTGLLPMAQSRTSTQQTLPGAPAARKDAAPATQRNAALPAAAACTACGVVESVRTVQAAAPDSGVMAGGVVGGILGNQGGDSGPAAVTMVGAGASAYTGHELERNVKKSLHYEIRVRMDDRSVQTFTAAGAEVGVGQRVRIRDGRPVPAG
jgi:outer membrane lipoprotein SlyB